MQAIPPRQKVRQRIADLFTNGVKSEEKMASMVIRLGVERLIQEMLQEEVKDHLGRARYERRDPDHEHRGDRNGYEPGRMRTGEGEVEVQVPRVRLTWPSHGARMASWSRS